jgi:hypothetical protein
LSSKSLRGLTPTYNVPGIHEFPTEAAELIPQGKHQVRMEFAYDGGGLAKGGNVTLYYDGTEVGKYDHDYFIDPEGRWRVAMASQ